MIAPVAAEPVWISESMVRALHRRLLAEHRGRDGMRGAGLLAAALYRPRHLHHYQEGCGILLLAAAYGYSLIKSRPFLDGNRRTAYLVMRLFLARHGWTLAAPRADTYATLCALAAGALTEEALAAWLARVAVPR